MRAGAAISLICLSLCSHNLFGQLYLSDNAVMDVGPDALLHVNNGDIENEGDLYYAGEIELIGNLNNGDRLESVTGEPSLFSVTGDWINDGTFQSGVGEVVFNGNSQVLGGTNTSAFYDLNFLGQLSDVKDVQTSTSTGNELDIDGAWIELNTNQLSLFNAQYSIAEKGGVFHTDFGGKVVLDATAASINPYPIPFAYDRSNPLVRYAALNNPTSGAHSIGFYEGTPSVHGLDASRSIDSICRIFNDHFWFIASEPGVDVALQSETDPYFERMTKWDGTQWNVLPRNQAQIGFGFNHTVVNLQGGDSSYYTYYSEMPFVDVVPYQEIFHRVQTKLTADYYLPSTGLITWTPDDQLGCTNCPDPLFESLNSQAITIRVENDICFDEETTQIEVLKRPDVFMQNAFSPNNGDNLNNTFRPVLVDNETLIFMRIFNRWGEKLYEGNGAWDGTYQGVDVMPGVYLYEIKVRRVYSPTHHEFVHKSGTLQVLR